MKNRLNVLLLVFLPLLVACGQHSGQTITEFSGDYRYTSRGGRVGIAEFFNCADGVRYFVDKSGIHDELTKAFKALGLKDNDDAFLKVKGYLKKETLIEGIDPVTVFVAVEFVSFDKNRGCKLAIKR